MLNLDVRDLNRLWLQFDKSVDYHKTHASFFGNLKCSSIIMFDL